MLPRVLADAATASSVIYLVAYLWVIDAQNGAIAWWSVGLMVSPHSASRSQLLAQRREPH